jgi:hypothetical protein
MDDPGQPVGYMERTRLYYRALGYRADYQWAHNADAPFARLAKPLAAARIALLTTASPLDGSNKDAKGWRHVWSAPVDPAPDALDTSDLAWDRETTHTDDRESFLPLAAAAGSTACRRNTASARRWRRTRPRRWRGCGKTERTRPFSAPSDRCAIRP